MKVVFSIENILVSFTFWIETLGAAAINLRKIQFKLLERLRLTTEKYNLYGIFVYLRMLTE